MIWLTRTYTEGGTFYPVDAAGVLCGGAIVQYKQEGETDMIYQSDKMEEAAVLDAAQLMCAAARTAPKTRGIDNVKTLVLTGGDILALADKMEEIDLRLNDGKRTFLSRDAGNIRISGAVVLVGIEKKTYGLNCKYCGFESCGACTGGGGTCFFCGTDLGIAVSSAVSTAAGLHIDSRVMFSVGRCAAEMNYLDGDIIWLGIPLSTTGKNPYFDRK